MATETDRKRVRELTDGATEWTDAQLDAALAIQTIREFVHEYWTTKAAKYASLVDVSESGSSRSLSQLHKNALTIAGNFAPLETISGGRGKMTRPAVRG